jgi:hypothetical protein
MGILLAGDRFYSLADLGSTVPIALKPQHILKTTLQTVDEFSMECVLRRRQSVIGPKPHSSGLYQARAAKVGQVTGSLGLGNAQDLHDMTHAHFPVLEQVQDPQPGLIGRGPEHEIRRLS